MIAVTRYGTHANSSSSVCIEGSGRFWAAIRFENGALLPSFCMYLSTSTRTWASNSCARKFGLMVGAASGSSEAMCCVE